MAKKTLGRLDRADFPELDLEGVKVKVDTGAFTSCLHAVNIRERLYKGEKHLYFNSLSSEHPAFHGKVHRFKEFTKKTVKSSSGVPEERYFIQTKIRLFDKIYPITLSLTDRRSMRYPVLIGRRMIRNRFVVDVNRTNLSLKKSTRIQDLKAEE